MEKNGSYLKIPMTVSTEDEFGDVCYFERLLCIQLHSDHDGGLDDEVKKILSSLRLSRGIDGLRQWLRRYTTYLSDGNSLQLDDIVSFGKPVLCKVLNEDMPQFELSN